MAKCDFLRALPSRQVSFIFLANFMPAPHFDNLGERASYQSEKMTISGETGGFSPSTDET